MTEEQLKNNVRYLETVKHLETLHNPQKGVFYGESATLLVRHDADNIIGSFALLMVKINEVSAPLSVYLPNGFIEYCGALFNRIRSGETAEQTRPLYDDAKKQFQLYFDKDTTDEDMKLIYENTFFNTFFTISNLELFDAVDNAVLSSEVIGTADDFGQLASDLRSVACAEKPAEKPNGTGAKKRGLMERLRLAWAVIFTEKDY